jgi:hypothetical protein
MAKSLYETVPQSLSGKFGVLTNAYICVSILIATLCGVFLPANEEDYGEDKMWRFIFAFPIFFALINMALLKLYFTEEPVGYSIAQKKDKQAIKFLKKIYTTPSHLSEDQANDAYTDFITI